MANKGSGTGQGGKSMQDRELAARVRSLALHEIEKVLKNTKNKLYGPVLIKLAGSVLPRLNEHTGENGGVIPMPILNVLLNNHGDQKSIESQTEN